MNGQIKQVIVTEHARGNSRVFWVGVIGCIAQMICGVLGANGIINEPTQSAIMCGMGGLFLLCNANNPSYGNGNPDDAVPVERTTESAEDESPNMEE